MGEVANDGVVVSRQFMVGCDRHPKVIEMKRGYITEKSGEFTYSYTCSKCYQSVLETEVNEAYNRNEEKKKFEEQRKKIMETTIDKI